jgi:hypothetical protein
VLGPRHQACRGVLEHNVGYSPGQVERYQFGDRSGRRVHGVETRTVRTHRRNDDDLGDRGVGDGADPAGERAVRVQGHRLRERHAWVGGERDRQRADQLAGGEAGEQFRYDVLGGVRAE